MASQTTLEIAQRLYLTLKYFSNLRISRTCVPLVFDDVVSLCKEGLGRLTIKISLQIEIF